MIDINESVRQSALELGSQERTDAKAAYIKSLMFKDKNLSKRSVTYDAPAAGLEAPLAGILGNTALINMQVNSAIMNPWLTANIKNNTGLSFNTNSEAAYTNGIGYGSEYEVNLLSEVAAVRALAPGQFAYNPGYSLYGSATIEGSESYSHMSDTCTFLSGAGYSSAINPESLHVWSIITDEVEIRERLDKKTNLFNNTVKKVTKNRPITNLCFAFANLVSEPEVDQETGRSSLSFSVFTNSRHQGDPVVGGPYRSDENDLVDYNSSINEVSDFASTDKVGPYTQRNKHEAGLSWKGYQYAVSPKSISVSTDGFESVEEVLAPIVGVDVSTALIDDYTQNISVYPTEDGLVIYNNFTDTGADKNYFLLNGSYVKYKRADQVTQVRDAKLHFLKWTNYFLGKREGVDSIGVWTEGNPDWGFNDSTVPTGAAYENADDPTLQVIDWDFTNNGKASDNCYNSGANMVTMLDGRLIPGEELGSLLTTPLALDRTRTILSPLREAYVTWNNANYCVIPITCYIEYAGSNPSIPALLVVEKDTGEVTTVDICGFRETLTPVELFTDCYNCSMVEIDGYVGLVGQSFQFVLEPKTDPRLKASWRRIDVDWEGISTAETEVAILPPIDLKYRIHNNPFRLNIDRVYDIKSTDFEDTITLGVNALLLTSAADGNTYDCYTVTDYARYPIVPSALRGCSTSLIVYPMVRVLHNKSAASYSALLPEGEASFYFSAGTMLLDIPMLPKREDTAASDESIYAYASTYAEAIVMYPDESGSAFKDAARPKVTGGFCILPRDKLFGKSPFSHQAPF